MERVQVSMQAVDKAAKKRFGWPWGVLPAALFFLLFFCGGLLQAVWLSFRPDEDLNHGIGWAYRELASPDFFHSLGVTVGMAAWVSFFCGVVGLVAAILLTRPDSWRKKWYFLFQFPMTLPHLLAAYLLSQVLWQSGWLSRLAYHLGWIEEMDQFPVLTQDEWGIGVLSAYAWKEIPFMILLLVPFLLRLQEQWAETARSLGASESQTLRWVILPLLWPVWVGGMWILFAFVLGAYEIPALMAATFPGWVPVRAWQEYTMFGLERRAVAVAMYLVLFGVALIVGLFLLRLQRVWYVKGRRI